MKLAPSSLLAPRALSLPVTTGSRNRLTVLGVDESPWLILLSNIDRTIIMRREGLASFRAWPSERVLLDAKTFPALKRVCQDFQIGSNRGCVSMAFDKPT